MTWLSIMHICINILCFCCAIYYYNLYKDEKEFSDSYYKSSCESSLKLVDYRHDVKKVIKILQDIEKNDEEKNW